MDNKTKTACTILATIAAGFMAINVETAEADNQTLNTILDKITAMETKINTLESNVNEIKRYMNNAGDEYAFAWYHHCSRADNKYCINAQYEQRLAIANTQTEILSLLHDIRNTSTQGEQNTNQTPLWVNFQQINKLAGISITETINDNIAIDNNITELATQIQTIADHQQ